MKRNLVNCFILASSIILTGCGKDPVATTPTSPTDSSTNPKSGSKWVYRFTYYNPDGSTKNTADVTFNATEISYNGNACLLITADASPLSNAGDTADVVQVKSDGMWSVDVKKSKSSMWIKHPANKGDSYLHDVGDGTTDTVKVDAVNVTVSVPAGEITGCYMNKEYDTNSLENDLWLHPEKWLIKQIEYDQDANNNLYKDFMIELVSFTK